MADPIDPTVQFGAVRLPLADEAARTLLRDADPALAHGLDLLRAVLEAAVGARLVEQARFVGLPLRRAVAMALPHDPGPFLAETQLAFPLFALFRREETFRERTLHWREVESKWGFAFVLPVLTAGRAEQLVPILAAAAKALDHAVDIGAWPTYAPPGGSEGADVWDLANVSGAAVERAQYAMWSDGAGLAFPTLSGEILVRERVLPTASHALPASLGFRGDLAPPNAPRVPGVVEALWPPPRAA